MRSAERTNDNATHNAPNNSGITGTNTPKLDWATLETRRKAILQTRGELALKTDKGVKIDVREGFASFVDDHTIKVQPEAKPTPCASALQ